MLLARAVAMLLLPAARGPVINTTVVKDGELSATFPPSFFIFLANRYDSAKDPGATLRTSSVLNSLATSVANNDNL